MRRRRFRKLVNGEVGPNDLAGPNDGNGECSLYHCACCSPLTHTCSRRSHDLCWSRSAFFRGPFVHVPAPECSGGVRPSVLVYRRQRRGDAGRTDL